MVLAPNRRPQKRGEITRQKLLDATIETLTERGYAACSMPEMCKRAGLSRGAQLHHFPTKAELLAAAIEHLMDRRQDELREALREVPEDERTRAFTKMLWQIYSGPTFYAWLELAVVARTDLELRKHMVAVIDRFYDRTYQTLSELFPVTDLVRDQLPALARFITSFMDGVAVNRILDDDDEMSLRTLALFEQMIGRYVEDILHGAAMQVDDSTRGKSDD